MKDELKSELDAMFATVAKQEKDIQIKRDLEAEARAKFEDEFMSLRDAVCKPAFQEFADYIASNGWKGIISTEDASPGEYDRRSGGMKNQRSASITIEFKREGVEASYGAQYPHFSIRSEPAGKKLWFHESTIGPGHGGSSGGAGSVSLPDLNAELLQERLVKYFKGLLNNAGPRR